MSMNADAATMMATDSLGVRLRRAREDRGATRQAAAAALRLPLSTIEAMESDHIEQLGAAIYVRGHLRAYLRWLELPEVLAEQATRQLDEALPALHSNASIPRARVLLDRYAVRAVYVVLTLSIILPGLWVAMQRPGNGTAGNARVLERPVLPAEVAQADAPLPAPPVAAVPQPPMATQMPADAADPGGGEPGVDEDPARTVVASIAPFYAGSAPNGAESAPAPAAATAGWELRFSADSWVEIIGRDGERLGYGMYHAGDILSFERDALARVALGNAAAVSVSRDGAAVDVGPYQRANVARFAVSSDGSLQADNR